jgi:hypothetical protein
MIFWLEILFLIIKFGPTIIALIKAIWDLINKQPAQLQPMYKAQLREACKLMNKNKIQGNNALMDLKARLEANA